MLRRSVAALASAAFCGPVLGGTDFQCLGDCSARYSRAYCLQVCEIRSPPPQQTLSNPVEAFIQGQRARQEFELRQAEIARARAEAAAAEAAASRNNTPPVHDEDIWAEAVKEWAAEQENSKLKAENEALKQRLKELEAATPTDPLNSAERPRSGPPE
jgi:hypothetical protein